MEDGRCKLGLAGRLELVGLIESGSTLRAAAAALNVAPATAHRWWHRWQAASDAERASLSCLRTRCLAAAVVSVAADGRGGAAHPRRAGPNQLWAGAVGGPGWVSRLDNLEDAGTAWLLAASTRAAGASGSTL